MMNENETTETNDIQAIVAALALAKEQIAALEKQVKFARGTGDVTREAAEVSAPTPVLSLAEKVELALKEKPMVFESLARQIGEPAGKVQVVLKAARAANKVYNVGLPDRPRWVWRPGAKSGSKDLQTCVLALIQDQPMTFQDLVTATGGKEGAVQSALIEIRRMPNIKILNLGTPRRARYFIPPENAVDAHLEPKKVEAPMTRRRRKTPIQVEQVSAQVE